MDHAPDTRLELVEAAAVAFPRPEPLLGVAALDSAQFIAWSASGVFFGTAAGEWTALDGAGHGTPVAAAMVGPTRVEIVFPGAVVAYDRDGRVIDTSVDPVPGNLVRNAVRTDEWIVAVVGADQRLRVGPVAELRAGRAWLTVDPDTLPGGEMRPYRLGGHDERVFLSEAEAPFRTWRIGSAGEVGHAFAPIIRADGEAEVQRWIAFPMVDFGEGLIQTVADLASDGRLVAVYEPAGKPIRTSRLQSPFAIVGASGDRRHIVGVRHVGNAEIVLYRWGWVQDHD